MISVIKSYVYLIIVIIIIRLVLDASGILDMKIEGLAESILAGVISFFLIDTIGSQRKRS